MSNKFESNIVNVYGNKGKKWLTELPNIVAKIEKEWNLSELKPVDNLSMNYVMSGLLGHKQIVLKLSLNKQLIQREYSALEVLAGFGAVQVLDFKDNALLLEKLSSDVSLKTYLPERRIDALKIACEIVKKLHQAPLPIKSGLPTIEEKFSLLDKDWSIPLDFLLLARKFRNEIFSKYSDRKILHGDLHHENILQDESSWKVIDPHGVIGFPINEVWSLIQNIKEDIPFVANYFSFNIDDVKKCYFMHAVLSAIWCLEDNMNPDYFLNLVTEANNFL